MKADRNRRFRTQILCRFFIAWHKVGKQDTRNTINKERDNFNTINEKGLLLTYIMHVYPVRSAEKKFTEVSEFLRQ